METIKQLYLLINRVLKGILNALCTSFTRHCERSEESIVLKKILWSSHSLRMTYRKSAFSLVEILVALIIVSLITAALAPVITKKLSSAGITIVGSGSNSGSSTPTIDIKTECSSIDPNCQLCNSSSCLVCNDNYIVENGACVEKYRYGEPEKQADCDPYDAVYFPKEYNGDYRKSVCVSRTNVEQVQDLSVPNLFYNVNSGSTASNPTQTIFRGQTANADTCTHVSYDDWAGACKRTVGGYNANYSSCSTYKSPGGFDWSLLHGNIIKGWIANYSSSEELRNMIKKLNLCTSSETEGYAWCYDGGSSYCIGAYKNRCDPHLLWVVNDTNSPSTYYSLYDFKPDIGFVLYKDAPDKKYAASGRCILKTVWIR